MASVARTAPPLPPGSAPSGGPLADLRCLESRLRDEGQRGLDLRVSFVPRPSSFSHMTLPTPSPKPAERQLGPQRLASRDTHTQTRATSKSLLPVKSKEVDASRSLHPGVSENDVMKGIKPRRENGQGKAADTAIKRNIKKSYRPLSKQKSEEGLKDKNQILEAVNKQLHQKLTETQGKLKDLTEKVELLQKFQDNSLAILESKGLHPDGKTLESEEESNPDHMDSMLLLETLQDELKLFNETAKKQMEELQALKVKLKMKEEERARFLEQQTLCNSQVNDFTAALEEMEQLLEM